MLISGGLDSTEPWQGRWSGGVLVECVGKPNPSAAPESNKNNRPTSSDSGQIKKTHGPNTYWRTDQFTPTVNGINDLKATMCYTQTKHDANEEKEKSHQISMTKINWPYKNIDNFGNDIWQLQLLKIGLNILKCIWCKFIITIDYQYMKYYCIAVLG